MSEKLENLNLPNASVQKIIKEALPDTVNIGKDARFALSKAASAFVLYITSQASNEAQKANRKTLLGQDITAALEELEFENFIEPLQESLKEYKDSRYKGKAKPKKLNEAENDCIEEVDDETETDETI